MSARPTVPAAVRFWRHVKLNDNGCWIWTGATNRKGYGVHNAWDEGMRCVYAHRYAYLTFVGPIPVGLQLDHLCRTPACVNPAHLEPVTSAENTRRAGEALGIFGSATHCVNGHEFTPESCYPSSKGHRCCRACKARRQREYRARKRLNGEVAS